MSSSALGNVDLKQSFFPIQRASAKITINTDSGSAAYSVKLCTYCT